MFRFRASTVALAATLLRAGASYWIDGPLGYALVAEMDRGLLPQVAEQAYRQLGP